jgi:hypothetical protein
MTDEQIIYLSPEEELTNVRERLEHAQARHIILVIPPQTQLRSHVGWRLLRSRARELGKDVLVISSDRQIRSVVKAAGFRVADSQESSSSAGTRAGSRPSRSGSGGRTPSRQHNLPGRGTPERGSSTDVRMRRREQPDRSDWTGTSTVGSASVDRRAKPPEPETRVGDTNTGGVTNPSTFGTQGKAFGPGYDYRIETTPSTFPVGSEQGFDEADQLIEDYNVAQSIRKAAQQGAADSTTKPSESSPPPETPSQAYDTVQASDEMSDDPFTLMEDRQHVSLPEQRGSATIDQLNEGIPDIADYSTDILASDEIEDLGDEGDIVIPGGSLPHSWNRPVLEEPETAESSRVYGVRPRNNRQGILPQDDENEDTLPPIEDQSTLTIPQPLPQTPPPAAGNHTPEPQPLLPARSRVPARSTTTSQRAMRRPPPGSSRPVAGRVPLRGAATRKPAVGSLGVSILIAVLIFLILGMLVYFVPSADIAITIPSQSFSTPLKLTASSSSQQDVVHHTVPARTLTFDTNVTGTGSATGSKKVGTVPATGNVIFTNKGTKPVDVPTGTIVSTSNSVQFATTADALVLTAGSKVGNTVPVEVQAQSLGQSGNVPANSITVIPNESLAQIEQVNKTSSVNLSVTNPDAITNGGVGNAAAVAASDITKLKMTLDQQIQRQVSAWLARQIHAGDMQGKPVQTETLVATPGEGQVTTSGTFSERLSLHMTLLVVGAADLQAAAQAEFNVAAREAKTNYALAPQQTVSLEKTTSKACTPISSGTSITLCYNATGQITPQVSEQQIRDLLAGKTVQEAVGDLNGDVPGIKSAVITINPNFFPWVPWWPQHITVHFKVIPAPVTPKK